MPHLNELCIENLDKKGLKKSFIMNFSLFFFLLSHNIKNFISVKRISYTFSSSQYLACTNCNILNVGILLINPFYVSIFLVDDLQ